VPKTTTTPAIDRPGVLAALRAIRAEAHRLEDGHGYPAVSVRGLARALGHEALLDDVLAACVEGGFEYCLDQTIPSSSYPDFIPTNPPAFACSFGPDQLRSRLDCVDWRLSLTDGQLAARTSR